MRERPSYPTGRQGNLIVHRAIKNGYPTGFYHFWFFCPGCDAHHMFECPPWQFDGNFSKPSFHPSLTMTDKKGRCHLFLKEGELRYLADCDHQLKGQDVPLPEPPKWMEDSDGQ